MIGDFFTKFTPEDIILLFISGACFARTIIKDVLIALINHYNSIKNGKV